MDPPESGKNSESGPELFTGDMSKDNHSLGCSLTENIYFGAQMTFQCVWGSHHVCLVVKPLSVAPDLPRCDIGVQFSFYPPFLFTIYVDPSI